jgi:phage shock protein C
MRRTAENRDFHKLARVMLCCTYRQANGPPYEGIFKMTAASPTFLGRSDTFFGVCEALGQDLGFNANWLRIALGVGVLFAPVAVIATYAVLAAAVMVSRIVVPVAKPASGEVIDLPVAESADVEPLKMAA